MGQKFSLISVCIPAYNHEKYVKKTIKSVIDQNYKNIELIIIDDGSKDNTWFEIQNMKNICEKRFDRVVFISQKNQGRSVTLNRLFDAAKGDYIIPVASDDMLLPDAIKNLVNFLEKNKNIGLVVGNNLVIDEKGKICYLDENMRCVYEKSKAKAVSYTQWHQSFFTNEEYGSYGALCLWNHIANGWMFRKELWNKKTRFTSKAPIEDWWFMLQISKISKIAKISQDTFLYRIHGTNSICNRDLIQKQNFETLFHEWLNVRNKHSVNFGRIFEEVHVKKIKRYLNFIPFISIYKIKCISNKYYVIKFLNFYLYTKFRSGNSKI